MSLKIRFRFDGRCTRHPRYDPKRDGHPPDGKCEGCESPYVIHLYTKIAKRRAEEANLIVVPELLRIAKNTKPVMCSESQAGD